MTHLLAETLRQYKEILDQSLLVFLDDLNIPSGAFPRESLRLIRDFVTRGKGVRGSLFLHTVSLFGQDMNTYIPVAVSLELMHAGLLIQDDVMDHDMLRRGQETVFGKLRHVYEDDLAGSLSFLTGDICFFLANKSLLMLNADVPLKLRLSQALNEEIMQVNFAQMNDVLMGHEQKEPEQAAIESVYLQKTARYTFSLPLSLAGMVTGQTKGMVAKMEKFGEHIGFLFQLRDDELSLFGDEKTTGKPVGNDIRENKKTLLRHVLFAHANAHEKQNLTRIFGSNSITKDDIDYVRTCVNQDKILLPLLNIKQAREAAAQDILGSLVIEESLLLFLRELASFALKRSK